MKTTFKMKEATNKEEAIISILDVIEENPLWLNKCNKSTINILSSISHENREWILNNCEYDVIKELFIEMKTEYYNFKDTTQYNF
tara:strand:+ start:786 stop:1040 length:255 start_codon:yes stop_codon:yes gene_type:complete